MTAGSEPGDESVGFVSLALNQPRHFVQEVRHGATNCRTMNLLHVYQRVSIGRISVAVTPLSRRHSDPCLDASTGVPMPGYRTRKLVVRLGGHDYTIRALSDLQQFADPLGIAEKLGISSAQWSLFGQVWPSGRVLAEAMCTFDIVGKRILEIGCGLGLSSLVLQRRKADITASDQHPLAQSFLAFNARLNELPELPYRGLSWATPDTGLGRFDLMIGSDILYERDHIEQLASLLQRHAVASAEIVFTDPGRGNSAPFTRALAKQGYQVTEVRSRFNERDTAPFRGQLLSYRR